MAHRLREGHMVQQLEQCHRAVTWELQARTQLAVCLSTLQLREAKRCDCLWTALCSRTWKPIEMGQSLLFFLRQNLKVAQASFAILLPHTPKHWNHICKPHFSTLFTDDTVGAAWAYQDKTPVSGLREDMSCFAILLACAFHNKSEERLCEGHRVLSRSPEKVRLNIKPNKPSPSAS